MAPVGALLTVALLAACSSEPPGDQVQAARTEVIPVTAAQAVKRPVPVQLRANGTAQAYSSVTIMSQVDGQIFRVHFSEGQDVHRGDLLFTLDQRPFEAALRQAEANLARDMAQREQAQANLARDMAQYENAKVEERRYQELFQDGGVSREQYDQAHTAALALQGTIQADQAAVENFKAAIQADQAVVENARIQLSYTEIRSPMEGRTGSLLVHAGGTVKARDQASSLVVINQIHPVYVAFSVPEQSLADIRKYRATGTIRVEALIPRQEDRPVTGELTFVNNTVDPSTGTIQLKATFGNPDNRFWPGQFLDVVLTLTTIPDAVMIPSQAIQTGQQGSFVFVVKPDQTVEARPIVLGRVVDDQTVVERGLVPGEQVVTEGQIRLVPGARVEIRPAAPAAGPQGKV
jgi:multidrug efflux system membrane fusion protein